MLQPFQQRFVDGATAPGIDTAAMSVSRGNGKSWLGGNLAARALTPEDNMYVEGGETVLCAGSIEQARIVFRVARRILEPTGAYRFLDSATRCGITHKATGTRLRVLGSNARTAFGFVDVPLVIADEPGAWETNGGQLLHDAIQTAQGKPNSPLRSIYIGTLAPSSRGWWHDLIEGGSRGSTYVQALRGDPEKWESWAEIRRCNPLTAISELFTKKLKQERDEARRDSRLKSRFLSYRLNCPAQDEASMLLGVPDWNQALARDVPDPDGLPVVGVDLGGGRAWSAAVAGWPSGRVEAVAVCPGIPDIEAQEKRDRVPAGLYRKLVESGRLLVADGLRVPSPGQLMAAAADLWGGYRLVVADTFRGPELRDVAAAPVVTRRARWSEASEDIRALRKWALDEGMAVEEQSRHLLTASLAEAIVKNDESGNFRLVKRDRGNNTGRDDVAAALVLVAGELARQQGEGETFEAWEPLQISQ